MEPSGTNLLFALITHLFAIVAQLGTHIDRLLARIEKLKATIKELSARVRALRRARKRQAAPFSKGKPKDKPKRPGRKSGAAHGRHGHRNQPTQKPDEVFPVPLPAACPHCKHAEVVKVDTKSQFQVELPVKPIVREFAIDIGCCSHCNGRVQGRHPLQTSDALGAAASQLGPNLQAYIVLLNKRNGLSCGRVARALEPLGIHITRGTVAQVCSRVADRCMPAFLEATEAVKHASAVAPDETSWRVGGVFAWMHVLAATNAAIFSVRLDRSGDFIDELLGFDYEGKLTSDGYRVYEKLSKAIRQSCLNHLINRCKNLIETQSPGAARYPRQVKSLLQESLAVRDLRDEDEIPLELAEAEGRRLTEALHELSRNTKLDEDNERLAKYLCRNLESIFRFLAHPELPATNYWAEQLARICVVTRKVWGGNRTENGAYAQSVTMTVIITAEKNGQNPLTFIADTLRAPPGQTPDLITVN